MKLCKYYSLDECTSTESVFEILNDLQEDLKIDYELVESDILKIKDTGLSTSEIKSLLNKLNKYDVIDYPDYDDEEEDDEDDDEEW